MSEKGEYKRAYLLSDEEFSLIISALRGTRIIGLCAALALDLEAQRSDHLDPPTGEVDPIDLAEGGDGKVY